MFFTYCEKGVTSGGITHAGPYVGHLVEEAYEQGVFRESLLAVLHAVGVDGAHHAGEVGHHRAHHAARQAAAQEQRRHEFVAGVHEVAQEVVDELLCEFAGLHVGFHVYFGYVEAGVLEHALHGDDVRVHLAPRERFDGRVDDVGACPAHFQDAGH